MQTNTVSEQKAQNRMSALITMAKRLNIDSEKLKNTLLKTVFKGVSEEELLALVVVANEYGLNPLTKEIYAFPAKGGGIVPLVSIDGWINLCNSHEQCDGVEFEYVDGDDGKPVSCTAVIYRKDRAHPIRVTEYFSECFRPTDPWKTMPHRMLRHKALMQCARIAFGFSGITDEDEGRDIGGYSQASRQYEITAPKFEQLLSRKAELFSAPIETLEDTDDIPMGELVEVPVKEENK